jgi:transposase
MAEPLVSDELWKKIEPLLPRSRRKNRHVQFAGRKRTEYRKILNGIVFVLRTGVPWKHLLATSDFPSGETCRRWLVKWHRQGVWKKFNHILLADLRKKGLLKMKYSVVDSISERAPGGGRKTGPSPVDRRKLGSKHHVITDAKGTPLAVIITAANRHDVTQILPLVEKLPNAAGKVGRPQRKPKALYADRGYDSDPHREKLKKNGDHSPHRQKANRTRKRTRKKTLRR